MGAAVEKLYTPIASSPGDQYLEGIPPANNRVMRSRGVGDKDDVISSRGSPTSGEDVLSVLTR